MRGDDLSYSQKIEIKEKSFCETGTRKFAQKDDFLENFTTVGPSLMISALAASSSSSAATVIITQVSMDFDT